MILRIQHILLVSGPIALWPTRPRRMITLPPELTAHGTILRPADVWARQGQWIQYVRRRAP